MVDSESQKGGFLSNFHSNVLLVIDIFVSIKASAIFFAPSRKVDECLEPQKWQMLSFGFLPILI